MIITGRKARRLSSSAKIHPAAQISTADPYCFEPNNNSGARYHRAKTYMLKKIDIKVPTRTRINKSSLRNEIYGKCSEVNKTNGNCAAQRIRVCP